MGWWLYFQIRILRYFVKIHAWKLQWVESLPMKAVCNVKRKERKVSGQVLKQTSLNTDVLAHAIINLPLHPDIWVNFNHSENNIKISLYTLHLSWTGGTTKSMNIICLMKNARVNFWYSRCHVYIRQIVISWHNWYQSWTQEMNTTHTPKL